MNWPKTQMWRLRGPATFVHLPSGEEKIVTVDATVTACTFMEALSAVLESAHPSGDPDAWDLCGEDLEEVHGD